MTIETIAGMGDRGTTNGYPMRNFERFMKGMFVRNLDIEDLREEDSLVPLGNNHSSLRPASFPLIQG